MSGTAEKIVLNLSDFETAESSLEATIEDMETQTSQVESARLVLTDEWKGQAKKKANSSIKDLQKALSNSLKDLKDLKKSLISSKNTFIEADQQK